jgi:cobalt-zinc-cadmium efflux system membrane fusion protein
MNNRILIAFIIILASGLTACQQQASPEEGSSAQAVEVSVEEPVELTEEQIDLAGVQLGRPERRVISGYIECTGTIDVPPRSLASVYSPVNGFVEKVDHLPGEYVRKGTVLTTITHPDLVRLQRQFLESRSRLEALRSDYHRKDTLAGSEAASQRALEQARAEYEIELAHYNGIKAELGLIGIDTDHLEESGEIQPRIAIRAPVSGYIDQVNINLGKLIAPDDLLYQIVDDSHVHLELRVYAKDLGKIRKGQRIDAVMPGSDKELAAEVYLIGKMIDMETKTALVHGHFLNESVKMAPGTFLHAHIYIESEETWTVPTSAVVRAGAESFLFVEEGNGFVKMPVSIGRSSGDYVEVTDLGLREGQRIAVKGAYYINGSMGEELE